MAAALQLQDYQNWMLYLAREMDSINFGGVPNYSAQFPAAFLTPAINQAIDEIVTRTGFSPKLTDAIISVPVTSVVDFLYPVNIMGLQRVEYLQNALVQGTITSGAITGSIVAQTVSYSITSGSQPLTVGTALLIDTVASGLQETVQVTAVTSTSSTTGTFTAIFINNHAASCALASGALAPYRLNLKTMDEFDALAGTGFAPTTVITLGLPYFYREPVAGAIRFYPRISSNQVSNGDQLIFTGTTLGTTLVNNTDVANIPIPFQRAACYRAAADMWTAKGDDDQRDRMMKQFEDMVMRAKAYRWDIMQSATFGIIDEAVDATTYAYDGGNGSY